MGISHHHHHHNATHTSHPGCACREGYEGNHCEYLHGTQPVLTPPRSNNNPHRIMKVTLLLLFGLSLFLLVTIIRNWHLRKIRDKHNHNHNNNIHLGGGGVPVEHIQMG